MAPRTLLLVRHGQTSYNAEGRYQGHCDIPLSEAGRAEAHALRARLARLEERSLFVAAQTVVITSSLLRARETAEIAFGIPGRTLHIDPDLRETSFGLFEGLTRDEIDLRYPGKMAEWVHGDIHASAPGGESRASVRARAKRSLETILAREAAPTVVAVTHGGTMRQLLSLCFEEATMPTSLRFTNTVVHAVRVDTRWTYEGEL